MHIIQRVRYEDYHIIKYIINAFCQWFKILLDASVNTVKEIIYNYLWLGVALVANG